MRKFLSVFILLALFAPLFLVNSQTARADNEPIQVETKKPKPDPKPTPKPGPRDGGAD